MRFNGNAYDSFRHDENHYVFHKAHGFPPGTGVLHRQWSNCYFVQAVQGHPLQLSVSKTHFDRSIMETTFFMNHYLLE